MSLVAGIVAQNRAGAAIALASVCSAQPDVLGASLLLAKEHRQPILVEATSNQVNQFGGYTGMTPADFIAYVRDLADKLEVDPALVVFGGDHLGPQVWRGQDAETAMGHARDLMRACVEAGFTKIHLDCSEGCAGEPAQVDDALCAARAAELARVCEAHATDPSTLCYVVGTEVPPPGGARAEEAGQPIAPTRPERARHALTCHQAAFAERGLEAAWDRVVGLVVQPGLEFAPTQIYRFDTKAPDALSDVLSDTPGIAFEAHSTDYQYDSAFPELARRHFAVLKVGPALTFAYRQALYALDEMSEWFDPSRSGRAVANTMERLMLDKPCSWENHYGGDPEALRQQLHFGYADRIRYCWPEEAAQQALAELIAALDRPVPAPMIRQYFAQPVIRRADALADKAGGWARALVWAEIQEALSPYLFEVA